MIKKLAFTMYPVSDVPRARKFYEQTLGLEPGMAGGREGMWWIEYDLPGGGCLAITNTTGSAPGGGATVALEVENLDRLIADLKRQAVPFKSDLIHGPNCRMAVCLDSEGNQLLLHQLNPKPKAGKVEKSVASKPMRAKAAAKPSPRGVEKPAKKPARGKPGRGKPTSKKPATRSRKPSKR